MINTQCQYDAMLGMWRGRGYRLREVQDNVTSDTLLVLHDFNGDIVGSYYKSKMQSTEQAASIIQKHCQNWWDSKIRHINMALGD